jgi:hypothetical protein
MATKKHFDPKGLRLDDGQEYSVGYDPMGLQSQLIGAEQSRQRDPLGRNTGMSPGWGSYFGLLQAKENAANAAGMNFRFDEDSWGNEGAKQSTVFDIDQVPSSLGGLRNTHGLTGRELLPPPVAKKAKKGVA